LLNIEIKGVQFFNKGAELMLVAILEQLDKELPDYQITLSPGRFLPYNKRAKLGAWQKLSFRRGKIDLTGIFGKSPNKLLNFLKRYGIVTEKDVDVILDASGFAYGKQWGSRSLVHTAKEIKRFRESGKKYIFLPQAFGPFESTELKKLSHIVFSQANLVFPRDNDSFRAVLNCMPEAQITEHIIQSPDFTCLIEPKPYQEAEKLQNELIKKICFIPNNKMVSGFHHQNAENDEQQYINFFVQAGAFYQSNGWQVVLLNHEGREDQELCQKISSQLSESKKVAIKQNLSAVEIKAYIGNFDAVLSSRFHGCVSALTQGIPCLATSWSHKYQMLFQEYGLADNVIDFKISELELIDQLTQFNQNLLAQKQICLTHSAAVKEQTRHMWKQVFSQLSVNNKF